MSSARLTALGVAVALLLTACPGGGDDPPPATQTEPPAPTTTDALAVDGRAAATSFFEALASRDPERTTDLVAATAPNTIARRYALHQRNVREILGVGQGGTLERAPDRAVVCSSPAVPEQDTVCTEFRDLAFDEDGLLTAFTLGGTELDDRIVVDGPAVTVDRITVRELSAYRSPTSETTLVVLEVVNNSGDAFELFGFGATYRPDEASPPVEADASWGEADIPAGATGLVLVRFPNAELGGVVQVSGWNSAGVGATFAVRIAVAA